MEVRFSLRFSFEAFLVLEPVTSFQSLSRFREWLEACADDYERNDYDYDDYVLKTMLSTCKIGENVNSSLFRNIAFENGVIYDN